MTRDIDSPQRLRSSQSQLSNHFNGHFTLLLSYGPVLALRFAVSGQAGKKFISVQYSRLEP
jgi:hypothetical protein